MEKIEKRFSFFSQKILESVIFSLLCAITFLRFFNLISEIYFYNLIALSVTALIIKWLVSNYLNFMLVVRDQGKILEEGFKDNRSIHFLNFDAIKFVLILVSIFGVIYLGVNRILNNETIATLLGGLIGSLLTIKGSYQDPSYPKLDGDKTKVV